MPIVDHSSIPETPWRPNYRQFNITRPGDGTTSSTMDLGIVGVGAGAPLHVHEADELIVVLGGTLEVRLGDEVLEAGPDHTLVIPPNVPHGFYLYRTGSGAHHRVLSRTGPLRPHHIPGRATAPGS